MEKASKTFQAFSVARVPGRVTSFGELSPIGRLFTLGSFFTEIDQIFSPNFGHKFWATFLHGNCCALILKNIGLGFTFMGRVFTIWSSGHPASRPYI
jgi:hypothetical protein